MLAPFQDKSAQRFLQPAVQKCLQQLLQRMQERFAAIPSHHRCPGGDAMLVDSLIDELLQALAQHGFNRHHNQTVWAIDLLWQEAQRHCLQECQQHPPTP